MNKYFNSYKKMVNEWCDLKIHRYSTQCENNKNIWYVVYDKIRVYFIVEDHGDHTNWVIKYNFKGMEVIISEYEISEVQYSPIMEKAFARFLIAIVDLEKLKALCSF